MEDDQSRFRCHPEPSGTWTVWDEVDNAPASLGGCSLVGRTWQRAKVACDLLRRIYDNRLEAVVKLMGDGALVAFDSVVDAVACAAEIQSAAAARNEGLPEPERIVVHTFNTSNTRYPIVDLIAAQRALDALNR
ncbi:hypothetical protein NKH98_32530 [Mesorhizobium sp. M0833]|uniref:hypothetical protein n=1 Tax=Mesorhizobium sp. M0833 TaxID=2957009 RepID=UPI003334EB88